jgi:hypothetical protein
MSDNSWTAEIFVPHFPGQVFDAVTNVRGWWNEEVDGGTTDLGDEFTFTDGSPKSHPRRESCGWSWTAT